MIIITMSFSITFYSFWNIFILTYCTYHDNWDYMIIESSWDFVAMKLEIKHLEHFEISFWQNIILWPLQSCSNESCKISRIIRNTQLINSAYWCQQEKNKDFGGVRQRDPGTGRVIPGIQGDCWQIVYQVVHQGCFSWRWFE